MTQEVTVGISCHELLYRYEIKLASTESDGLSPLSEYGYIDHPEFSRPVEVNFAPRGTEAALSRSTLSADGSSDMWDTLVQLQDNWPGPFFLDASATAPIMRLASINDNRRLRSDGSNLASFLYYLRRKEHSAYEMIRRTVRLVAPFFDDFIPGAAGTGRGQDPAGVAPPGVGRLLRCFVPVGWLGPVHRVGDAAAAAHPTSPLAHHSG